MADAFSEFDEAGKLAGELTAENLAEAMAPPPEEPIAPEVDPFAEEPPVPEAAEATGSEPKAEPSRAVPYDRFEEVNARARRAEEQRDELIKMLLDRGGAPPQARQPQAPVDEDINPEVEELVAPILRREMAKFAGVEDLLAERQRASELQRLNSLMPGFAEDYWPQVQEEFKKLPPDQQREFDSPVGALALAAMIRDRKASASPEKAALGALSKRAHSEGQSRAPSAGGRMTADDIYNMSDGEFNNLLGRLKNQAVPGRGYVDPLIR